MSSQYQQELQSLKASACPKCGGSGKMDDAEAGDTYYNEWTCGTCKGSGFAPRPTQETRVVERCNCGIPKDEHPDGTSRECYALNR